MLQTHIFLQISVRTRSFIFRCAANRIIPKSKIRSGEYSNCRKSNFLKKKFANFVANLSATRNSGSRIGIRWTTFNYLPRHCDKTFLPFKKLFQFRTFTVTVTATVTVTVTVTQLISKCDILCFGLLSRILKKMLTMTILIMTLL